MRDEAIACLRAIGVETGGSNVQFAVDPATGRRIIIEMNPRVSRSSALASKATGFPDRQDRRQAGRRLHASTRSPTTSPEPPRRRSSRRSTTSWSRCPDSTSPSSPPSPGAGHVDAERRGGHGDRAHLPRGAAEGAPQPRDGPAGPQRRSRRAGVRGDARRRRPLPRVARPSPDRIFLVAEALRRGLSADRPGERDRASTRGSSIRWRRSSSCGPSSRPPGPVAMPVEPRSGWVLATPNSPTCGGVTRRTSVRIVVDAGHPDHLQDRRHLCRRVRGATPYFYGTFEDEDESPPPGAGNGRGPRVGAQPHRPGHRVRLLLRPRLVCARRRRLRDR